jgi:OmcA/MtrC family decaheme c-type cytochrome
MKLSRFAAALLCLAAVPLVAQHAADVARRNANGPRQKASSLDANAMAFIRPGIAMKVVSAAVASDGTITVRFNITDPKGLPLDRNGVQSPGAVSFQFIAAYIPNGSKQYVAYTTSLAKATLNSNPSQLQAGRDSGGTFTDNAVGDYTYTFATKAPKGFDATATHTIGIAAQRDLSEWMTYDEWSETANVTFDFVPNGTKVATTRQVVPTSACNQCHDPLIGHGGSRNTVEMCILCHTPQTINPDTGLTQDMPVLIHKIHMGKNLPSVQAGTPYRIWHRGAWSDFSDVGFPSGTDELKTCTVCHKNAPQTNNYMTVPTRAACGACHDDVNFVTGAKHSSAQIVQVDDKNCGTCHIPQGNLEFDASIKGAHMIATRSAALPGVKFTIVSVANAKAGQKPTVTFTVTDNSKQIVDISKISSLSLILTGPTTDYNGYTSENARTATLTGGQYVYTFSAAIPAGATGSYAVAIEGYNNVTIYPGTPVQQTVRDVGYNQVYYFSVDGSKVAPRRAVVSGALCNTCHEKLMVHGGFRQNIEYCTVCHNPGVTDVSMRAKGDTPESINFKTMIHKIHTGAELKTQFTVMGHGNSVNNFNDVGYPGDRRDCQQCHLANTNLVPLPAGTIGQAAPRDYITTQGATTAACLSCHDTKAAAAHALINTSSTLGESCEACHSTGMQAGVDKVHDR